MKKRIAALILNLILGGIGVVFGLVLHLTTRFPTAVSPSYSAAIQSLMLWYGYALVVIMGFILLNCKLADYITKNKNKNHIKIDKPIVIYNIVNTAVLMMTTVVGMIISKNNNLFQLKFNSPSTIAGTYDPFILAFMCIYAFFAIITITVNIVQYVINKKSDRSICSAKTK